MLISRVTIYQIAASRKDIMSVGMDNKVELLLFCHGR
jgi:hypothetical protein